MGKLCRIKCKSREEWLSKRKEVGLGASEAAAVVGASPFMTANELWRLKTGKEEPKDLSDNEFVQKGIRLEPALRNLYKALHPTHKVTHHPYDMLYMDDKPNFFATLDGEIKIGDGRGILEIKTATPSTSQGWDKWKDKIPANYYMQILHQLHCTGYDFAVVFACLFNREEDFIVREYQFIRSEIEEDIAWLLDKEEEFWKYVQSNSLPPMTLIL